MSMDWDKLRVFHAVAQAGSFTHAGEQLNLSQSAVSRQISTLEDSMGVALFHRHARGLILTEQGELLFETTKEIFQKLSHIEGQIMDTRKLAGGPLLVTVAEFFGTGWLLPRIKDLRRSNPDIQLTILFEDRILNIGMREADIALRMTKPEQPDLIQRHLTSFGFHVCASRAYLNEYGVPESIKDLRDHRLIGFLPQGTPPFSAPNWLFEEADINVQDDNIMLANSVNGIICAVENDAGIGVLPDYVIHRNKNLQILLPHLVRPDVDLYFVYAEERRNSKRIATFRDFLLRHIGQDTFKIS
ncbi:MAG: LysR family transcriptional regulator [Alphaproteobacteria bacterium]